MTPGAPPKLDGPAVDARVEVDGFDAGDRARREEREQRVPCEGRPVRDAQLESAVGHEAVGDASARAQLLRA